MGVSRLYKTKRQVKCVRAIRCGSSVADEEDVGCVKENGGLGTRDNNTGSGPKERACNATSGIVLAHAPFDDNWPSEKHFRLATNGDNCFSNVVLEIARNLSISISN